MTEEKVITGQTEDEIWNKISADLKDDTLEYRVIINQQQHKTGLVIDIDLGGGFESGYSTTSFISTLITSDNFRFSIHHQGFLDELGKFFGLQDVEISYADFDKSFIIKTNNPAKTHEIFSDGYVRETLQKLQKFSFGIVHHKSTNALTLELIVEDGITDVKVLQNIYHAFYRVLVLVDNA